MNMRVCFAFDRCSDALHRNKSLISSDQKEYQRELERNYHSVREKLLPYISSNLATLKTKHHRRYVIIHTQNKAPQAVCHYTHSKQSTTCDMSVGTLKTKQAPQAVFPYAYSQNKAPQVVFHNKAPQLMYSCTYSKQEPQTVQYVRIHNQNKTPLAVCPYTHSKESTIGGKS